MSNLPRATFAPVHQLSDALVGLNSHYDLTQDHFQRWIASTEEVNAAELLVDRGKAPIDILLDSQRRRANAQIDCDSAVQPAAFQQPAAPSAATPAAAPANYANPFRSGS